jgi:hypothetical protein
MRRAEEIHALNQPNGELGQGVLAGELAPEQSPSGTLLLDDVYRPLCLKLFMACAFKALAEQLKSQLKQRNLLRNVREIVFSEQGHLETFGLSEAEPIPE